MAKVLHAVIHGATLGLKGVWLCMWLPGQLLTDFIPMQALYVVTPPRLGVEEV